MPHWTTPQQIINAVADQFRIDKWLTQPNYIEVWIEKDALLNIMEKVCNELDIPYFSCRGYTSQSEMWAAGIRLQKMNSKGKTPIILHFGDHDPSGIDMTRDIQERLSMFAKNDIEVKRVALNMDQIIDLNAPPNPAKITDSRAKNYIRQFGNESWELDAIEPPQMAQLVRDEIGIYLDADSWDVAQAKEDSYKENLQLTAENFQEAVELLGGTFFVGDEE